jgi:hypothetical protein
MAEFTFDVVTDFVDKSITAYDATYATAQAAVTGEGAAAEEMRRVGQLLSGGFYNVYRGYIPFNTISLAGMTVLAARLDIPLAWYDATAESFDVDVISGCAYSIPTAAEDFAMAGSSIGYATVADHALTMYGIDLDPADINTSGITKLGLRSYDDLNATYNGYHTAYFMNSGVNVPQLVVTTGSVLTPADRTKTVKDITTLEAIRNIEMTAQGRLHVNESGNLVYESRFKRSL